MVTSDIDDTQQSGFVSTGSPEMDKKLDGGVALGSLTVIDGQSSSGKSVICQQITHGALSSGVDVAFYTTENTITSLLTQMASINLDVTDYFLMDYLRIYRPQIANRDDDSQVLFDRLAAHIDSLPENYKIVIVDSITRIVTHGNEIGIVDFFSSCKELCEAGRAIFSSSSHLRLRRGYALSDPLPLQRPPQLPFGRDAEPGGEGDGRHQGRQRGPDRQYDELRR